jgi:hypothetical protein
MKDQNTQSVQQKLEPNVSRIWIAMWSGKTELTFVNKVEGHCILEDRAENLPTKHEANCLLVNHRMNSLPMNMESTAYW